MTGVTDDTTLTVSSLRFPHSVDDPLIYSKWDLVEFYNAQTETGAKTLLLTKPVEVDDHVTEADVSTSVNSFLFIRFSNSITGLASAFSQAIPASGFAESTVQNLIQLVRKRAEEPTNRLMTDDAIIDIFNEAIDDIETKKKNWTWREKEAYIDLTAGVQAYAMPADLAGPESILSFKLGKDGRRLDSVNQKELDFEMEGIENTKLTADTLSGATTVSVIDTTAFATTGTMTVDGITATYGGKTNKSFIGITGFNKDITSNADVFIPTDLGRPERFSLWQKHARFFPIPDQFYNVRLQYYASIPRIQDSNDKTVIPQPYLLMWYALWVIWDMKESEGKSQRFQTIYEAKAGVLQRSDKTRQNIKMQPASSYFPRVARRGRARDKERLLGDS